MKNFSEYNDLSNAVFDKEDDLDKLKKAKNILSMAIDPNLTVHVSENQTAKDIWETFQRQFDDTGVSRKTALLRQLLSIKMESCAGMQEYVNEVATIIKKLEYK
jgi:gag-polypeptide of LTR copia-type